MERIIMMMMIGTIESCARLTLRKGQVGQSVDDAFYYQMGWTERILPFVIHRG